MIGQVVRVISGFYDIEVDSTIFRVRGSGNLRESENSPVVGDFVDFSKNGLLNKILDRKNFLIRPKVSNVDYVVIVTSLNEPKFSSLLLDRFLIIVESQNIEPIIVFTKSDLGNLKPYDDYKSQNYNCFYVDNKKPKNIGILKNALKNKLSVFTGQSGVGKSSTINNILNLELKTDNISQSLGRGKHTTRVVEMHKKDNIKIIDTPGFSSLQINLTKLQISKSFKDFRIWSKKCKFTSCLHYKEQNCEIKKKLENKELLKSRYDNYIKILTKENL